MKGKNLVIRGEYGRVVDFLPNEGKNIEDYHELEWKGYKLERTDDEYVKKWDKWWAT